MFVKIAKFSTLFKIIKRIQRRHFNSKTFLLEVFDFSALIHTDTVHQYSILTNSGWLVNSISKIEKFVTIVLVGNTNILRRSGEVFKKSATKPIIK